MADTAAGAALTDAHRVAQVQLALQGVSASMALWGELNPADLPGTRLRWLNLMITVVRLFDFRSGSMAGGYLSQFRQIEGNPGGPIVGERDFNVQWAAKSIDYNGPGRIVSLIKQGMNPVEAKRQVTGTLVGAVQKQVLQGGRRVVDLSALANPVSRGWRRVTDSDPCTFCALLVSRGPDFKSAKAAGEGREWHYKCGCTVEEVFGRWRPTKEEKRCVDAYYAVSTQLRKDRLPVTAANVLPRLRKDGGFRDSPPTPAL